MGLNALLKPFVMAWFALGRPLIRRRYGRLVLEEIDGVPLLVLPEVFNPVLLRTGAFLARTLKDLSGLGPGTRVLDMGTGSGVGGVFAARRGARVVAVDINPEAVRCASLNALLNRVEKQVEVRHGDLYAALAPGTAGGFDLVLFNPPFYAGEPRDPLDHAWRGTDVFERFASGLGDALAPGGRALLVLSTDGAPEAATSALVRHGFALHQLRTQNLINEVLTAYECRLAGP